MGRWGWGFTSIWWGSTALCSNVFTIWCHILISKATEGISAFQTSLLFVPFILFYFYILYRRKLFLFPCGWILLCFHGLISCSVLVSDDEIKINQLCIRLSCLFHYQEGHPNNDCTKIHVTYKVTDMDVYVELPSQRHR